MKPSEEQDLLDRLNQRQQQHQATFDTVQNIVMIFVRYLRLFVKNHKAQKVSEVQRPEWLPPQHNHIK